MTTAVELNANDTEDLIGYADAAKLLGVAIGTVYAWVSLRKLPHYRISSRCVRFSRRALLQHIEARAVAVEQ